MDYGIIEVARKMDYKQFSTKFIFFVLCINSNSNHSPPRCPPEMIFEEDDQWLNPSSQNRSSL
jgi:hypothetical protein